MVGDRQRPARVPAHPAPSRHALTGRGTRTSASARHVRPICPLADFTSLCRLTGDLGDTARFARRQALREAALCPPVPAQVMLASPT